MQISARGVNYACELCVCTSAVVCFSAGEVIDQHFLFLFFHVSEQNA